MANNARDRLIKFSVQLELDPQALAKVETQFKQLTDERRRISRRVEGPKKEAALAENNKKLNDLMQERLGLEEALAVIKKKNDAEEAAATKREVAGKKQKIGLTKDEKKAEEELGREKDKNRKATAVADASEESAAKKRLDRRRAELRLAEDELRAIQKKAALPGQISHYNKTRQAANTLAGITSVANMTPEQLEKAKAIWSQYAATVKKADLALFNHINGNLARHKAQNQARIKLERDLNKNLQDLGKMRAKAQKDGDAELLRIIKNTEQQLKQQHKRVEEQERTHQTRLRQIYGRGGRGGGNRGMLEIGAGSTGRGLLSGAAGMGGLNLYGLGIAGAGGALIKGSLGAYAEVFALKNVLSGIITTFNQFKDAAGKPVSRAENFNKSIDYSEFIYERLRKAAIDSPLTLKELSDVYTTGYPFLARQGVSAEKSIGIANTVASLGKAMGLRLDSIKDDIRAIYEGRFRNVQTFQAAGFTSGDFKKLSTLQGDDLVNFFNEKFSGYQDALKRFSGSFIAQWDNMIDSLYQSGALLGEKIAPTFIAFAKDVRTSLGNMAADGTLDRFAAQMKTALDVFSGAMQFLVASVGTTGNALMTTITNVVNMANNLLGKVGLDTEKGSVMSDISRGMQSVFQSVPGVGADPKWAEEIRNRVSHLSGQSLSAEKRPVAILGALETLKKQKNPREFVAGYRTQLAQLQEVSEALNLVEYLETGEGIPKDPSLYTPDDYRKAFGKRRVDSARRLMEIFPDFNPTSGEYTRQTDFGGGSFGKALFGGLLVNSGDATKERLIKLADKLSRGFPADLSDLAGLGPALSFLEQKGFKNFPTSNTARPKGGVGPALPDSGGLANDPVFNKIYDEFKNQFGPTPILTPKVDTGKTQNGFTASTRTVPKDLTKYIQSISSAEQDVRSIQSRIEMNPKQTPGDMQRALSDQEALLKARVRLINAQEAKRLAESQSITSFVGKGDPKKLQGLKPHVAIARDLYKKMFGINDIGGYRKNAIDKEGHPSGLALDLMVPDNEGGKATGDSMVDWTMKNAKSLGVDYIIWQQQISKYRNGKWGKWTKMKDRGSRTANHYDHPHVNFIDKAGTGGFVTTQNENKLADAAGDAKTALTDALADAAQKTAEVMRAMQEYNTRAENSKNAFEAASLELALFDDLNSDDPARQASAKTKLLNARSKGVINYSKNALWRTLLKAGNPALFYEKEREYTEYLNEKRGIEKGATDAEDRKYQEGIEARIARERAANDVKRAENARLFQNRMSLTGKFGSDATLIGLDQKISKYEGDLDKGGLYTVFAQHYLPALYAQKKALEENTDSLNRMREEKLQTATDRIFNGFGQSGFAESYQGGFNRKMSRIDSMLPGEINKVRAGLGIAGMGMSDAQIKFMMKSNAMSGYSREDYVRQQYKDQAASGVEQAMQAILVGEDPITALSSTFQNITGMESMKRLTSALFNKGRGYKGEDGKGPFNRGQFTKDLISGGGSFGAQYIVNQALPQNSYAQEGSQLGGLAASMGAFAGLGAWAGPVGILAGGLIGSLFGKKKAPDPAVEQHRKRLEELLETISNRLKPQEDFYRMFKGVYGAESRRFAGRGSILGSNAALGAI